MIEVEGLRKDFVVRSGRFRRERRLVHAVNGISFRVERGELLGYLGPNGAGKSTTIKMLTGILVPTGGRVSVAGLEPSRKRIQLAGRIGAMFGQRIQLWWDLPLRDSFELLRHIYRVPAAQHRVRLTRFREADPVQRLVSFMGLDIWLVTGYDEAKDVLADGSHSTDIRHLMGKSGNVDTGDIGDIYSAYEGRLVVRFIF